MQKTQKSQLIVRIQNAADERGRLDDLSATKIAPVTRDGVWDAFDIEPFIDCLFP